MNTCASCKYFFKKERRWTTTDTIERHWTTGWLFKKHHYESTPITSEHSFLTQECHRFPQVSKRDEIVACGEYSPKEDKEPPRPPKYYVCSDTVFQRLRKETQSLSERYPEDDGVMAAIQINGVIPEA